MNAYTRPRIRQSEPVKLDDPKGGFPTGFIGSPGERDYQRLRNATMRVALDRREDREGADGADPARGMLIGLVLSIPIWILIIAGIVGACT